MKDKKDFIEHIAGQLRSHEENYEQGAWENFVQQEKKKKIFPLFWVAAACFVALLGAGIFYVLNEKKSADTNNFTLNNPSTIQQKIDSFNQSKIIKNALPKDSGLNIQDNNSTQNIALQNNQNYQNNIQSNYPFINFKQNKNINNNIPKLTSGQLFNSSNLNVNNFVYQSLDTNLHKQIVPNNNVLQQNQTQVIAMQNKNNDSGKLDYFPNESSFENDDQKHDELSLARWTASAVVAPSFSNNSNKLNMGYGASVGYNVSNKVSINSGATYTQLTGYNSSSGYTTPIEANVTGINIPVELKYQISNRFYVSGGASALAVLSNTQQRTFVGASSITAYDLFHATLSSHIATPLIQMADVPQSEVGNQKIAGFYNFSFGMQQKLGASTKFSIEPFIALPMNNNFSKQNIHLTNGGIKLKIGF